MHDDLELKGRLIIKINDEVIRDIKNLVVTAGKDWVASRMKDATSTVMTHMAIGTGTAAAVIGDTTLGTEITRQAVNVSGGTVVGAVVTWVRTFGGTMLARTVFAVVNKGEADSMTISWSVTIS